MSSAFCVSIAQLSSAGQFAGADVINTAAAASVAGTTDLPGAAPIIYEQLGGVSSPTSVTASGPLKSDQLTGQVSATLRSHVLPTTAGAIGFVETFAVSGGLAGSPSALNMNLVADQLFLPSQNGVDNAFYAETQLRFRAVIAPGDSIKYSVTHSVSKISEIYTFSQQGTINAAGETIIVIDDLIPQPEAVAWTGPDQTQTFRQAVGLNIQIFSNSASTTRVEDVQLIAALETSPAVHEVLGPVGDFDGNLKVDGADFLAWQRQFGSAVIPLSGADANGDGLVNQADLVLWKSHASAIPSSEVTVLSVPEPSSACLLTVAATSILAGRRRRRAKF
ncbi:dockerin type I domain-containing protein [Lacipirellula limnantheis]|nr:dockerin type I domain-containing protein [Lacipirellula limnantheis]